MFRVAQKIGVRGPLAGVMGRHVEMMFVEQPRENYASTKEVEHSIAFTTTLQEKHFTTHPMEGMCDQGRSDRATSSSRR